MPNTWNDRPCSFDCMRYVAHLKISYEGTTRSHFKTFLPRVSIVHIYPKGALWIPTFWGKFQNNWKHCVLVTNLVDIATSTRHLSESKLGRWFLFWRATASNSGRLQNLLQQYQNLIEGVHEISEPWSYMKFPLIHRANWKENLAIYQKSLGLFSRHPFNYNH